MGKRKHLSIIISLDYESYVMFFWGGRGTSFDIRVG